MERDGHAGSFQMHEDDGVTREHEGGRFLKTLFTANMTGQVMTFVINPPTGTPYTGAPAKRSYHFNCHRFPIINGGDAKYPAKMAGRVSGTVDGAALQLPVYGGVTSAQFHSKNGVTPVVASQHRTLHVWTGPVPTGSQVVMKFDFSHP